MALTLRADKGSALTFSELDANFTDYKTFRDTFDRTLWINANDGKVLYWNEANAKVELKSVSTDSLIEGSTNLFYTDARFDTRFGTKTTDNLSEGSTNLYYTDARVATKISTMSMTSLTDVNSVSAGDDGKVLTYNNSTGNFQFASMLNDSLLPVTDHGTITDGTVISGATGVTTTQIEALSNVSPTQAANGQVLVYNSSASEWQPGTVTTGGIQVGGGVTTLLGLNDVPGTYVGEGNQFLRVKSAENGIEFVTPSTDNITEGSTNLFYTDGRVATYLSTNSYATQSFVNAAITTKDNTDEITEGSSNLYFTDARADARIAAATTADLTEGANLYFTNARADARISAASLTALGDVDTVVAGDNGKILYYDHSTTSFKWKVDSATPSGYNNTNWDDAYAWGNHASAGYLTSVPAQSFASLTGKPTTIGGYGITDLNASINVHLNQSNPTAGYVLSWNGSDYAWVDNAGYSNSDVDTHLNRSSAATGEILSWDGSDYAWTAPAGGSTLTVQDEGSTLSTAATTLNFVGAGVTASGTGATKTITIAGGGGSSFDQNLNTTDSVTFAGVTTTNFTVNGSGTVNFTGTEITLTASNRTKVSGSPFRLGRITTAQRNAISSPTGGDMIFNTDTNKFQGYNGTSWVDLS
tara:strand:+ start:234 stop:2162 length:1929 start_codon:yes stop_codon:yes gene_type:complete